MSSIVNRSLDIFNYVLDEMAKTIVFEKVKPFVTKSKSEQL